MSVTSELHTPGSPLRTFMDEHFPRRRVARFVRRQNSEILRRGAGGRFKTVSRADASRIGTAFSYVAVLAHTAEIDSSPVAAHQKPRDSGRLADGMRIGRKLAGAAVHG